MVARKFEIDYQVLVTSYGLRITLSSFSDQAIILKSLNLGESDRLLTVLTRYHGKVVLVGKGVRKISSRRGGHLDLFNHIKMLIYQPKRVGSLFLLSEVELITSFDDIKSSLTKVGQAWYLTELIDGLVPEGEINPRVFDLLASVLKSLGEGGGEVGEDGVLLRQFEVKLLTILGYWSEEIQGARFPRDPTAQARFNQIFIESILEKNLKTQDFLKEL